MNALMNTRRSLHAAIRRWSLSTLLASMIAVGSAQAQTYNTVYGFKADGSDAESPVAGLVRDAGGNLWGTSFGGGPQGSGAVYQLDGTGHETVVYFFTGGADGASPEGSLIRDSAGNFYGTTVAGGAFNFGTVFKIDSSGKLIVLHSFAYGSDGRTPVSALTRDKSGNLYGTAAGGGTSKLGVVFKVDTAGVETVLHTFEGGADGAFPVGVLIRDGRGNLYGTTAAGGASNRGTVFLLDSKGKERVVYSFAGGSDGQSPGSLVRDSAGNLYGATNAGGPSGSGTVFKIDPSGKETVLYSFAGGTDGQRPSGGLVRDLTGNLYGTTDAGGTEGFGTVFKVDPTGKETVLHSFALLDGARPEGCLLIDSKGRLYGTTLGGGSHRAGVVFRLMP